MTSLAPKALRTSRSKTDAIISLPLSPGPIFLSHARKVNNADTKPGHLAPRRGPASPAAPARYRRGTDAFRTARGALARLAGVLDLGRPYREGRAAPGILHVAGSPRGSPGAGRCAAGVFPPPGAVAAASA